jgi:hypothetical protein
MGILDERNEVKEDPILGPILESEENIADNHTSDT